MTDALSNDPEGPGQGAFGPTVDSFDRRIDELLDQLRVIPVAD